MLYRVAAHLKRDRYSTLFPFRVHPISDPRIRTVNQKVNGTLALADGDGSVGDPASDFHLGLLFQKSGADLYFAIPTRWLGLGLAVLLRNWTRVDITDMRFSTAAGEQLGYLLNCAPRSDSGAISHRESEVRLRCVSPGRRRSDHLLLYLT